MYQTSDNTKEEYTVHGSSETGFIQILNLRGIVEGFVSVKNYRKLSNSVNTKMF